MVVVVFVLAVTGGIVIMGGGNLYSGHSVTGCKGGSLKPGILPILGNVGAKSFLLLLPLSTLAMLESDKRVKIAKEKKLIEAIFECESVVLD